MQRTAVIYGFAIATLVAAFLLAPRLRQAPPPPPPQPLDTASPVTELTYQDDALSVTARIDKGLFARMATGEAPLFLDVAVKAHGESKRPPLTAVLVVDRSGSMAGDKIEHARAAAERFVLALQEGDQLGLVTFATDVMVDMPITAVDDASRQRALRVVRGLEEGGGTNIDGGLDAARDQLGRAQLAGRIARVVFVSDGRPTEGDRRLNALKAHASRLRDRGITLSTLGLGLDYNEDLMEALAVEGGGRYHYLRKGDELARILDDELKHATAVAAQNVRVRMPVMPLPGLRVSSAPGTRMLMDRDVILEVGDLAAGEERHVLVRLDADSTFFTAHAGVPSFHLAAPELAYLPASSTTARTLTHAGDTFRVLFSTDEAAIARAQRADVVARVLQVQSAVEVTESMQAYASGDVAKASTRLQAQRKALSDLAASTGNVELEKQALELDDVIKQVANEAPSSSAGQDIVKYQKARAFRLRR